MTIFPAHILIVCWFWICLSFPPQRQVFIFRLYHSNLLRWVGLGWFNGSKKHLTVLLFYSYFKLLQLHQSTFYKVLLLLSNTLGLVWNTHYVKNWFSCSDLNYVSICSPSQTCFLLKQSSLSSSSFSPSTLPRAQSNISAMEACHAVFDPWCHPKDLELRDGTPLQSGISHWSCKNHTHAQFACLLLSSHPQTRMSLVIWVTAMGRLACNVLSLQGTVLLKPTSLATSLDIPLKSLTFLWLLFVHVWWSSSCTTSTVRFGSFTFLTSPPLFLLYAHSSIFPPDLASLTAAFVGFSPYQ